MPIPLILFYDKANLDRSGGLAVAPLLFTWGFFKNSVRHKSFVWRIKAYIPNLDIGQGKSNLKSADEKQREHHLVLAEALKDFQEICEAGGFKTYVGNKLVILKFFIQYIVGDTAGHNDLCCHFQKNAAAPCRDCHCTEEQLSLYDTSNCVPITMKDLRDTNGNQEMLRLMSQRHRVDNAMYRLPFADRLRGIHGCSPWETLHVFDQGLTMYIVESFHDILGEKDAGKIDKATYNAFFRVINQYLNRQSERDFPCRDTLFSEGITPARKDCLYCCGYYHQVPK